MGRLPRHLGRPCLEAMAIEARSGVGAESEAGVLGIAGPPDDAVGPFRCRAHGVAQTALERVIGVCEHAADYALTAGNPVRLAGRRRFRQRWRGPEAYVRRRRRTIPLRCRYIRCIRYFRRRGAPVLPSWSGCAAGSAQGGRYPAGPGAAARGRTGFGYWPVIPRIVRLPLPHSWPMAEAASSISPMEVESASAMSWRRSAAAATDPPPS